MKDFKEQLMDLVVAAVKEDGLHPQFAKDLGSLAIRYFPTMRTAVMTTVNPARFGTGAPEVDTTTTNTWVHPSLRDEAPAPVKKNTAVDKSPTAGTDQPDGDELPFESDLPVDESEMTLEQLKELGAEQIFAAYFGNDLKRIREWMVEQLGIDVAANSRKKATLDALDQYLAEN